MGNRKKTEVFMAQKDKVQIAPSLICTDLCNLERDVHMLEAAGVDYLHVDLLDGHFSPSMPIGIEVVRQVRKKTRLPFDVHLMVENNEFFIREMAGIGVQRICFHYESAFHVDRMLDLIRGHNIQAGIALSPATSLTVLDFILEKLDFVLLMLINPGFAGHAGEKQVPYALRKIEDCRRLLDNRGLNIPIEVDGRVCFETIPGIVAAGAGTLVTGSSCLFHKGASFAENLKKMKVAINSGLAMRKDKNCRKKTR